MKLQLALLFSGLLTLGSMAHAQNNAASPPGTVNRPDARYPNPSGQDSNPGTTPVKPTKTAPPTAHPEDSRPSTTGAASRQTYQGAGGKKPSDNTGCSTPTDPVSAGVKVPDSQATQQRQGKQTVCTTSGGDSDKAPNTTPKAKESERKKPTATAPNSAPQ
jgi:hypothetical protein